MDDILQHGSLQMRKLAGTIPDIKERVYLFMIWSFGFSNSNAIIKNLMGRNNNYYIGKINDEYLSFKHIEFMKILLWNEFSDSEFIEIIANITWFFSSVINHKNCFKSENEFEDFVMNFAAVIVNGLFSNYKDIKWNKTFKEITAAVPKLKNN